VWKNEEVRNDDSAHHCQTRVGSRPRPACGQRGEVALPSDKAYAGARQIWNSAVEHRPALFAFCETPEDVQAAVRAARAQVDTAV
jgi:hypothetical protein